MVKIIDQELILLALCKVVWDQSQKTPLEQYARPVRPIMAHDQNETASAVRDFRKLWSTQIALSKQTGEKTNFKSCKQKFFNNRREYKNWTQDTRNLYSSATSIYMTWDRTKRNISQETLNEFRKVSKFIMFHWEYDNA